jgi:FHS family L-fucose permease-like MFS transporter
MAITPVGKSTVSTTVPGPTTNYGPALVMVTTLFFMWGFITSLNDILIPHLRGIFDLNYTQSMLVQFVWFLGYFVFALPGGKVVEIIGYKAAMVLGLVVMGLGAALFIPASSVLSYPFFLTALIVISAGITVLQVAANAYVSVLGKPETASSRLNLAQAFNSLGTTVAPKFGSLFIIGAAPIAITILRTMPPAARHAYELQQASSVRLPYLGIALAFLLLAAVMALFKLPKITGAESEEVHAAGSIWKIPHVVLGALAIFVYVGAEVSIGSFLINYFNQPDIGNLPLKDAANLVTFYWGGAMVGRFIGSAILQRMKPGVVLGVFAFAAFTLVCISMLTYGHLAVWSIIAVGLFNSIMFPTIFTLGIAGLGPVTGEGSGLLIMAIVGGAIIPVAQGAIADSAVGIHHAFILPLLCYLYIAYYGFRGSKPRHAVA